jgi:glycosyltransferase involved in cell wall biosynthesis
MKAASPKVSVLLPVRDGEPYFAEALESILAQQGVDFEIVVIDDGSSDGTTERLSACKDPRLIVIRREGDGLVAALNCALAAARGDYIARMDADDVTLPGRLFRQAEFLDANPAVAMVHCSVRIIDAAGNGSYQLAAKPCSAAQRLAILLDECPGAPIIHPSVMMRRAALVEAGGYRNSPACEDHELWLRVVDKWQISALPEVLLHYRQHAGGISRERMVEQSISHITNACAYRYRQATKIDLIDQDPARYASLRALVSARAGPILELMMLAKTARRQLRQGFWGEARASLVRLTRLNGLAMLSNKMIRQRILALQLDVLACFTK